MGVYFVNSLDQEVYTKAVDLTDLVLGFKLIRSEYYWIDSN